MIVCAKLYFQLCLARQNMIRNNVHEVYFNFGMSSIN